MAKYETPFSSLRCVSCRRPLWDGGHSLNENECSIQGGEVCRLWKRIHKLQDQLKAKTASA